MTTENFNPIEPDGSTPPKFYPRLYRRLRLFKWLALVGGVGMIAGSGYEYSQKARLNDQGVQAVGKLFDQSTLDTGKGRTSYRLVLDYQPPASKTVFRKEFVVSKAIYDQATQAGQATVTYLSDDPQSSVVGEKAPIDTEPLAIGVGLLLASAGIWYYQRREWQKIHAYITGQA